MEQTNNSGYKAVKFLVFAARALAGIGTRILDQTTRDRTFMIEMVRQRKEERREKLNRKAKEHAKILKQRISKWAQAHRHEVEELYEQAGFPYLEDFQDRTIDIVQPLAAIAEVAYRDNGPTMQIRADLVEAVATTRKDQESLANEFPLLQEFTRLAESQNPLTGNVSELTQLCKVLPEPPHDFEVEAFVQKYGFERKSIRKDGGNPKYRYILPHEKLADLLSRYGSSNQPGKEEAENDEVTTA